MQFRKFSVAVFLFLFCTTPVIATVAEWDRRIAAMDLATLGRTVVQPGQPKWPLLRADGKASPGLSLAITVLRKIEESEAANASFDAAVAPARAKTYLDLARAFRDAGGYDNLLLADALDRVAMVRLGRWAIDRPEDLPKVRQIVATMTPVVTPDTVPLIVRAETNLQPADFAPAPPIATKPARGVPQLHPSELLEIQIRDVSFKLSRQQRTRPTLRDNGGERTIVLLKQPNFTGLITRMRGRDHFLVYSMPGILEFVEKGGKLAMIREDCQRALETVLTQGPTPVESDLFADFRTDLVPALRTIANPGVGTYYSNVNDYTYASAIDPPAQTTGQVSLTVTEKALTKIGPAVANDTRVVTSPSGKTWAYVQPTAARPGVPPGTGGRVVINGQAGPELTGIQQVKFGLFGLASTTGEKIAYIGNGPQSASVYVNHRPGPAFNRILPETLMLSDDGSIAAYVGVEMGKGAFVVIGTERYGPYESVSCLTISSNGKRAGWIANVPTPVSRPASSRPSVAVSAPASVYLDGKAIGVAERVELPVEASHHRLPEIANRRMFAANANRIVISDDGTCWAYLAKTPEGLVTRIGGRRQTDYRYPAPPILFSSDGATLLSFPLNRYGVVVNGKPVAGLGGENDWGGLATEPFAVDGTVRYMSPKGSVVIRSDGQIIASYPGLCYFSPSGKRVVAQVGGTDGARSMRPDLSFDLSNGRVTKPTTQVEQVTPPFFGPDNRFYFVGEFDQHIEMIAEGDAWPAASHVGLLMQRGGGIGFNADGRYAAAPIRRGWTWRLAVNGCETREGYDLILPAMEFSPAGLRVLAVRDDTLIEVNVKITDIKPQQPAVNLASAKPGQQPTAPGASPTAGLPNTSPAAPASPATAAPAGVAQAADNWKRTIVAPDTRSPVLAAFLLGGQPAIIHLRLDAPNQHTLVMSHRRGATWASTRIDSVPATVRLFDAVVVGDVVYLAISHSTDTKGFSIHPNAIRVLAGRGAKWTVEWESSETDHFGGYPKMGVAGGQPFVVFTGTGGRSAANSRTANFAARDKAGKWISEGVPIPHNAGISGFATAEVEGVPAFSYHQAGGHPRQFAIRRDGKWAVEEVKDINKVAAVLNDASGPAVLGNAYVARKAQGWVAEPLYDQTRQTVVGFDAKVIDGVATAVYLVRDKNEMHLRRRVNGAWDDQLIDFGSTNMDRAVSIVPLPRGFGIAYIAVGPTGTSLVWLEPKK